MTLRAAWPSGRHSVRTSSARGRTPSSYWRMRRRWEAFWVLFSTGYDPKRESIEEDSTPTRAGRRQDGSYCGRPACPSGGGQATCPQIRGTDLKVLGFNIGAQVARATVPCLPAAGVFLAGDSARVINPPRPAVSSAAKHRGVQDTPTTWPGSCGSGAPWPGWSHALLDIPITQ